MVLPLKGANLRKSRQEGEFGENCGLRLRDRWKNSQV